MSAHGAHEEFVEKAWQEIAVHSDWGSGHLNWFKRWFAAKLVEAVAVAEHETMRKLIEEKGRHNRTQEWLDKFQGVCGEQALEIAGLTKQVGELTARLAARGAE